MMNLKSYGKVVKTPLFTLSLYRFGSGGEKWFSLV